MASSPPPPPPPPPAAPSDISTGPASETPAASTEGKAEEPASSDLKVGSGRKREREGSMEPSDKMSALKLAALGVKKVKEDEGSAVNVTSTAEAATGDLKPLEASSSSAAPSLAPAAPSDSKPKAPTFSSFTSSGFAKASSGANAFSAFANAKPFSTAGASTSTAGSSSFDDILSKGGRGGEAKGSGGEEDSKAATGDDADEADAEGDDSVDGIVKLEAQDTITGEEDEDTRHQLRCKLYVLEKEGGWKERGTGMFKLNVNIDTAKPRLLMRADGVLRLILNVALFPGMSCERQDKWVRFSAFEDAQLSHLAVRAGSVKSAEELCDKIKSLMPADSSRPESAPKSPTPAAAAGITLSSSTEVTFKESSEPEAIPDAADSVV